jgi:hypothetical protein
MAEGREAATAAKTRALFIPVRDCFWEQEVLVGRRQRSERRVARASSQHRHGRMLSVLVRVEAVWLVDNCNPRIWPRWSKSMDDDGPVRDAQVYESIRDM